MTDGHGGVTGVAGSVVESLRSSPVLLALVVFNALFVGVVYFASADNKERQSKMVEHLLENQSKMQEMIARCRGVQGQMVIPPDLNPGG